MAVIVPQILSSSPVQSATEHILSVSGPVFIGGVALSLVFGVIYPAVWSGKPQRRRAALEVIKQLLRRR